MALGASNTMTPVPTDTPVPSPTIGHAETAAAFQQDAINAQQTANAAIAANAAITAEFEVRVQEQLNLTAEADRRNFEIAGWTQTAAPTSIALTSTAQLIVIGQQTLQAGQMTATANAPTQIVAMAKAQVEADNAKGAYWVSVFGISSVIFVIFSVGVYLLLLTRRPVIIKRESEQPAHYVQPSQIEVTIRDEKHPEKTTHRVIPCSLDQLMELAEMVVNGVRSFPYNAMEKESRTFKGQRETLRNVRDVLDGLEFVVTSPRTGEGMVDSRGVSFFEEVFSNHQLPDGFEFGEGAPSPIDENA